MATLPENDNGLNITKPVAVWNRNIEIAPGKLLQGIAKAAIKGASLDWSGAGESALDSLDAAGLQKEPGELAWLLIYRSLISAISQLISTYDDLFLNQPEEEKLKELSALFEKAMSKAEVTVNLRFFDSPGDLPLLNKLRHPLVAWLHGLGASSADAERIASRLSDYFITALHEKWREAPQDYAELKTYFDTPFTKATEESRSWRLYGQWLKSQVSDRMFSEVFGVDKVYVPLRAYYEEKEKKNEEEKDNDRDLGLRREQAEKIVFDLESDFLRWLKTFSSDSAVRFISGGPGSGKSTFVKIFAARVAEKTNIPTLYIPLHLFDASDNLIAAMENHIRNNRFLSGNPLDAKGGQSRLLIIFDGLDELASQGKAASEVANAFVDEVLRRISEGNNQGLQRQVIITGRTIAVQSVATKLREKKQISYVLPYFVEEREREQYHDPEGLLAEDQRQTWWRQYGEAAGKGYDGLPADLDREHLAEITTQPLLNYLVALSYERKNINFSDDTTLNQIYADLIKAVYCRQYEECGKGRVCVSELDEEKFVRVLEEIALAVWHGDGRTATVAGIQKKCASGGIDTYLKEFQEGAKAGVTRLLTAFYFRQSDNRRDGDPTFEFTHKSFGEYLTALRIIRLLRQMQKQRRRRQDDPDDGWSEKEALRHWTGFCAVTAMDEDLLRFISNEFLAMQEEELLALQGMVCDLLSYTINQGLPFPDQFRDKGFKEHLRLARNAEAALVVVHCGIAELTKQVSKLDLESDTVFGEWISRARRPGHRATPLSFLDLSGYYLAAQIFWGANFAMSRLEGTQLTYSILVGANLSGVNLEKAVLFGANLQGANLEGANLKDAELSEANLQNAKLEGANLEGADLTDANLKGTILEKKGLLDKARRALTG